MDAGARYDQFIAQYNGPVKRRERLAPYTTLGAGGDADLFLDADSSDRLAMAVRLAGKLRIPYFVIGGGSNLLIGDRGFRGLVIRNRIQCLEVEGNEIKAGAGEDLNRVVDYATARALSGLEFAAGIWGTVGGAIYGNAGAFGSNVGSVLSYAELFDAAGELRREPAAYFEFTYRNSKLKKTGEIVTLAAFGLKPGEPSEIAAKTAEIRALRDQKHPTTRCSAGCFFKNVADPRQPHGKMATGKLLEEVGAKSLTVGDAAVFERHANIIVNRGRASAKDIRGLADILKERVRQRFGLELEEEVVTLGEF